MSIIIRDGANAGNLVKVDGQGNLSTMTSPAAVTSTAASWSSSTAINATQALLTSGGYPAILLQLNQSGGTFTGGAVTIEGTYDGTDWVTIPVAQILDPNTFATLTNPYTFVSSTNRPFLIVVGGYQQVRLRLSTVITGSGTVTPFWSLLATNPFAGTTTIGGVVTVKNLDEFINGFVPDPFNVFQTGTFGAPSLDINGQFITRGLAFTDEGSFRDDFPGSTLTTTLTGTLNFTNGQTNVTGSGTSFTTQIGRAYYIKQSTDPETLYTRVASIDSDTQLTLETPYGGTTSLGATGVVSLWATSTGAGGSISVTSSDVNLVSGTTNPSTTGIQSGINDYLPLIFEVGLSISQAINFQKIVFGLQDIFAAPQAQVVVVLSGTDPTVGMFMASSSSAGAESTSVAFTFPGTDATNTHKYRISLVGSGAYLSVDETIVATITDHIPGPYTVVTPVIYIQNTGGVPSSSTTVSTDYTFFSDVDRLEISNQFDKPLVVQSTDSSSGAPNTLIQPITATQVAGWDGTHLRVLNTDATGKLNVNASGTVAVTQSTNPWVVSGTVTANQGTSPWVVSLTSTTITGTVAVTQSTSPWVVSGTVTANAGTGNFTVVQGTAANLNATVVGTGTFAVQASQTGSWTVTSNQGTPAAVGNAWPIIVSDGVNEVTVDAISSAPVDADFGLTTQAVIYGKTTAGGGAYVAVKVNPSGQLTVDPGTVTVTGSVTVSGTVAATQSGTWTTRIVGNTGATLDAAPGAALPTNAILVGGSDGTDLQAIATDVNGQVKVLVQNTPAVTVSGTVAVTQSGSWTVTANQGTNPWVVSLASTTITGTVAVTQSTSPWIVAGNVASGAADTGNPVKTGGVFNTTQPTVTNAQRVDSQSTARGAQIVATGVDTFNVTVNAALPAGTNVIGHVITDTGSTTAVTGNVTVVQPTGTNLHAVIDSGTITTITNTVTVSGTVTANIGTTGGLALDASVTGLQVSQGSTTSGQKGDLVMGAVTTNTPSYATGQTSPLSLDTNGLLRVSLKDTPSNTNNLNVNIAASAATVTVSGTVTANQGTSPWVVSLASTTITGTVAVTQSTSPWTIQGDSASGAAKAGNPVQIGGVFNTTQPTVTTGQTVEAQSTARGAAIVATGVDTFNVTVNTALPAGTNVIGHVITDSGSTTVVTGTVAVTQSTSPWVENVTQWASTALGTPQTFGTAPSGVVIGTSSDIYVAGTRARSNQTTTAAGVLDNNLVGIAGTTVVTAAAGIQKVGISGATGVTLDAAQNAAAPANELVVGGVYQTTIPALTAGNASQLQVDSTGALAINEEGRKQTYRAIFRAFTPVASTTSPMLLITGSATKTVRITRVRYSSTAATGGVADLFIERFSTITGGTVNATATAGLLDGNNAAATATVKQYSTVPATATASGGPLSVERYETVTAAVSVPVPAVEWDFGDKNGQGLVLRGTSDFIGIMISAIGTTPVADFWVEWTEE